MLYWLLKCPQCKIHLTLSKVHVGRKQCGLWMVPSKPEFHQGGSWIECSNCNTISLFQRFQLEYATTRRRRSPCSSLLYSMRRDRKPRIPLRSLPVLF